MPVLINQVKSTVHAIDPSSLLTPEFLAEVSARVVEEMRRSEAQARDRQRDTAIPGARRVAG